jgi:hypothetical protein
VLVADDDRQRRLGDARERQRHLREGREPLPSRAELGRLGKLAARCDPLGEDDPPSRGRVVTLTLPSWLKKAHFVPVWTRHISSRFASRWA